MTDVERVVALAEKCGATVYRHRSNLHAPAVAFGDESWARFCAAVESLAPVAPDEWMKELERLIDTMLSFSGGDHFNECRAAILAHARKDASGVQASSPLGRDADWALAMAEALGTDSGYEVPIVPTPDAFRCLFAEVRKRAASGVVPVEGPRWQCPECGLSFSGDHECRSGVAAEPEPDCWAILTPNGSKLVSPEEAKGRKDAYPLYTREALMVAAGVAPPRTVTPQEDAVLRRAALRSGKVVSPGVQEPAFIDLATGEHLNERGEPMGASGVALDLNEQPKGGA